MSNVDDDLTHLSIALIAAGLQALGDRYSKDYVPGEELGQA